MGKGREDKSRKKRMVLVRKMDYNYKKKKEIHVKARREKKVVENEMKKRLLVDNTKKTNVEEKNVKCSHFSSIHLYLSALT